MVHYVPTHAHPTRRTILQAGSVGLLGLGMNHVAALRAADSVAVAGAGGKAKSVIFIFLSGGLTQHDSFDLKPNAPADIRGEFQPIATAIPGVQVSELLPHMARDAQRYVFIRSLVGSVGRHDAFQCQSGFSHQDLESIVGPNRVRYRPKPEA